MITLVRATQTAMACPSQWDAWDAEGNYYYLRYRHGIGEIRQYQTPDWAGADEDQLIAHIADFAHGGPYDGDIGLDAFAILAGIKLSPELAETNFGDHLRDELVLRGVIDPAELLEKGNSGE